MSVSLASFTATGNRSCSADVTASSAERANATGVVMRHAASSHATSSGVSHELPSPARARAPGRPTGASGRSTSVNPGTLPSGDCSHWPYFTARASAMAAASGNVYDGCARLQRAQKPLGTPCEPRKHESTGLGPVPAAARSAFAASLPRTIARAISSGFVTIGGT